MTPITARFSTLLLSLSLLAGCGGGAVSGAFGPTFPDNRRADIDAVLQRLAAHRPPAASPVAVGLTTDAIYAYDLAAGRELWRQSVTSPVSAPHIAGNLVFLHESAGIIARDMSSGATRFRVDDDAMHLVGAGGSGELAAAVLSTGGGVGARSRVLLARGGSLDWNTVFEHAIGAPTVAGGLVFLPWATQNVTVLDAATGNELARIRVTDATVGRAEIVDSELYVGLRGRFRLTSSIQTGSRESAAYYEFDGSELPGRPMLLTDPYRPPPSAASAVHSVRMVWRPTGNGDEIAPSDGLIYLVFYKLTFALDGEGQVRWVYQHGADIVGASAQSGGLLVADADGGFAFVGAADGLAHWTSANEASPTVVRIRGVHAPSGAAQGEVLPLREQLLSAAQNTDARLVPARTLAVQMLASLEDDEATSHLIDLCDDRRLPGTLKVAACTSLAQRTTGADQLLAALQRHATFLEGTSAPPVGPLAQAAATMEERRAVPLLLSHLRDPETSPAALAAIATALGTLGDRSAAAPLLDFLRLYHADASGEAMVAALGSAAEAYALLQGPVAEEELTPIAADGLCQVDLRQKIQDAIGRLHAQAESAGGDESGEQGDVEDSEAEEEGEEEAEAPARPERVTGAMVAQLLEPVEPELTTCVRADPANPASARIVIVLDGDGAVQMVSTSPTSVQRCIESIVREQTFPGNRRGMRQQVTHTVRRRR